MIENKYKKWYDRIILKSQEEKRQRHKRTHQNWVYYERHHIIPKSFGGTNEEKNLVLLTAKEHYICHLLLCKFTEGREKGKMTNALIRMIYSKGKKQERYTPRNYAKIRELIAEKNRVMFSGRTFTDEQRKKMSEGRKGMKFSEEHKQHISEVQKGKHCGEKNHFFGKKHTIESRKKISISNSINLKGKKKSVQMRERLSASRKGMKFSEEHKKHMSDAQMGKNCGSKNPFFGKKHSQESLNKMSNTRRENARKKKQAEEGKKESGK